MTLARTTLAALTMTFAGLAATADAASYHSVDNQAVQLQERAAELYGEFNAHFRHASHYQHLRSDAAQMYSLARDIHRLAHRGYGINLMARKLDELDSLFHHLEELVEHIEDDAYHGHGHIHGYIGHVKRDMRIMEYTLHRLRAEVAELQHRDRFHGRHGHGDRFGGGHLGHGHGDRFGDGDRHGRGGPRYLSFGNGAFRIRIGH